MKPLTQSNSFLKRLDEIMQSLPSSREVEDNIIDAVETIALEAKQKSDETGHSKSKWACLADKIDSDKDLDCPDFQNAQEKLKRDMNDFKKHFELKNDL